MIAAHPTEGGDGRSFKREGMEPGFRRVEAEVREVIAACEGAIVFEVVVEFGAGNREAESVEVRKGKERVYQDALGGSLLGEEVGPFDPRNPYETDGTVE